MSDPVKLTTFGEWSADLLKSGGQPWLDTETAAAYLLCTPGTLRTWRSQGTGPRYSVMHGKLVRYHIDDLNNFVRGEDNR